MNLGLHMLNNGSGNAHTIKGTGSTTYFIQNNQTIGGSVFENLSHLVHFHHKGTLTTNQIITGTYAGKNPVHRRNISLPGRYKAANLSHKHQQSSLPHIGRFTGHIRAGNQHNLTIIVIQFGIVRYKQLPLKQPLHQRMPSLSNINLAISSQNWTDIIIIICCLRQGCKHIQYSYLTGSILYIS